MRRVSYSAFFLGVVLAIGAGVGAWLLADRHIASAERTSVLYAREANLLSDEGDNARAMLMALSGDSLAQRGPVERGFRPRGYYEGRAGLERGFVSNRLIRSFPGHTESVGSAVFSKDGALVLTGSVDGDVQLFRTDTAALIATFDGGEKAGAATAVFSGDEKQVIVARTGGEIAVWDVASRAVVDQKAFFTAELFGKPILSADGALVAAATSQNAVEVWDIAESRRIRSIAYGDNRTVLSLAFSPDAQVVLLGTTGARADVWSLSGGGNAPDESYTFSDLSAKSVTQIAMSPDLSRIIVADEAGGIFGFQRGSPALVDILGGGSDVLLALVFSPDGRRLLETSTDGFARVWDLESATLVARFRIGASGAFNEGSAAFSPDGSQILTGTLAAARLWRADTGQRLASLTDNGGEVNSVAFSPDGNLAITGGADTNARLWDVVSGRPAGPVLTGHRAVINAVAFSRDGKLAMTGSSDSTVRLWNAVTGARGNILSGHTRPVLSVAFSSNGIKAAAGAEDGKVRIWTLNTQASVEFDAHKEPVNSVAFSRDGSRLLTASSDGTARLWRISDQVLLTTYNVRETIWAAAFSPDERYVLTGSTGSVAILWPIDGGDRVRTYSGHGNNVSSLAFSPDGSMILTGSMDGTAALWRTHQDHPTAFFTGHAGAVRSVAFSPNAKKIVTGSLDGSARIWAVDPFMFQPPEEQQRLACGRLAELDVKQFTDEDRARFPILSIEPPRPCEAEWAPVVAAAPAPAKPPPKKASMTAPALRPASSLQP